MQVQTYTQPLTRKKIHELGRHIGKEFDAEKVIMFGSRAWGESTNESDIDLFIVKNTKDTRETARQIDAALWGRDFALDIIVYTPEGVSRSIEEGDFFVRNIIQKGETLYAK